MNSVHLNLDDAWAALSVGEVPVATKTIDLREWGPKLRYHGRKSEVDAFYHQVRDQLTSFVLYGSGDFHYLAGVLLRRIEKPVTVVSFDNHPDWDVRPPHWSCGGWVNRALELPNVRNVRVWGCGNFELRMPSRLFANRRALRSEQLQILAWAERQPPSIRRRFDCMTRDNWKERFERFSDSMSADNVYVTIDLDCLTAQEAVTNWESGLFTVDDLIWALAQLRAKNNLIAGDLCGAYSEPQYARWFQRFAGNWDHPRLPAHNAERATGVNLSALRRLWPAMCDLS